MEEIYGVALVPLILALVEMLKGIGLPAKFSSLVAVCLGLPAGIFLLYPADLSQGVIVGLALGLSAAGLYSGTKSVKKAVAKQ